MTLTNLLRAITLRNAASVAIFAATGVSLTMPVALHAQAATTIVGTWQGVMHTPDGDEQRLILKLDAGEGGALAAAVYRVGDAGHLDANEVVFRDGVLRVALTRIDATLTAHLSPGGNSMSAALQEGAGKPIDLVLERSTPKTAWPLPEEPKELPPMDAKADPSFAFATIKPTSPDEANTLRFSLTNSGEFFAVNRDVRTLLGIVYGVQASQIVGLPGWATSDRFDIQARSDTPGMPSWNQVNVMVKQLLAERFDLKLHTEQREMQAMVLTVAKSGRRMTVSRDADALADETFHGPGRLTVTNATMAEFASTLQTSLFDRPVIDQTGLGGTRYSFQLRWQLDDDQAAKLGMEHAPPAEADTAPPLLIALPEQTGLKLESTKTMVPVLVVDHIEKPSPN